MRLKEIKLKPCPFCGGEAWNRRAKIEAEPVKHGKWVKTLNFRRFNTGETHYIYTCSICDFYTGDQGRFFNYCPNCGAKMDGGDEK